MKILLVRPGPLFSVEDVANGWVKGLRQNGHEVIDFDLGQKMSYFAMANEFFRNNKQIKSKDPLKDQENAAMQAAEVLAGSAWQHQPDIILIMTGYYLPPQFYDLARRNHKVVLWVTESPYEDDRHLLQAEHCDALIVNDTKNLDKFKKICPTFYYGHGFDPDIHKPGFATSNLISEFSFVGTGFPERIEFFEQIDWSTLNVTFAGNWQGITKESPLNDLLAHDIAECIDNKDAVKIYQSSLISANLYRKQHTYSYDGDSCGPREIEMAACGLFFLREKRPESDLLFPMLPTFETPKELQDAIHYWLKHPEERQERADLARLAVQERSFEILAAKFTQDLQTI